MTSTDVPEQLLLFDEPPRRQRRRRKRVQATSVAARRSITPACLRGQQAAILDFLRSCGEAGAIDEEIQIALRLRGCSETARRCELADLGLVVDSGERRKSSAGRLAIVWRVSEAVLTGDRVSGDRG